MNKYQSSILLFIEDFFSILYIIDNIIWNYIGLLVIIFIGIYLTVVSKGYQFSIILNLKHHIQKLIQDENKDQPGINPFSIYFASIGGMIGLGNLVSVVAALLIGGPGTLFWMWISALIGMLIKYSEIYLGIEYRVFSQNGYNGGPMYYLRHAFKDNKFLKKVLPIMSATFLCIYGADVSQFLIITDTMVTNFGFNRITVIICILLMLLMTTLGGIKHFSKICVIMMPPFMISYTIICIIILSLNYTKIPSALYLIIKSAFYGHSAIGGFLGSTMITAMHYGTSRAVYSGDIGIGYDSIIHSETRITKAEKQAPIAVMALLSNIFISSMSVLIVIITDKWTMIGFKPSEYIGEAIKTIIPSRYVNLYIGILFFISGFTTIAGFFVVGQKCATFINEKFGRIIYIFYGITVFSLFSFFDQNNVMLLMSVSGGILMIINLSGIFKMRKKIKMRI
ncbi:amino acid carrier protein [Lyticum sinuosum]|uniref:Sodium:alanine symporter family protein n=1 Tax=Lyticum sinuosum TaxID=1332059 RepID=A0AAE4VKV8_9RICK|nr:amino acid carrier protein [Lyticum sinuosum]MDZ5761465.1 Sodium:alanine symporter family protein [Lyticum sinuosum]